jgi:hypothetical protein
MRTIARYEMNCRLRLASIVILALGFAHARTDAQLRYASSLSLSGGAYAASGFGTNHFFGVRYNYFFLGGRYFVEASLGVGSLRSQVLENVARAQVFETERLYAYEFVGAYDHNPYSYLPYFTFGVAGINQGGQSKFAGVLGVGKRIPLTGFLNSDQLGVRYDIRDQIFSQKINNSDPFISHNLAFTFGLQFYF